MKEISDRAARDKIIRARVSLLTSNGFFGFLAMQLSLVETTEVYGQKVDTMAVDGKSMFYNPSFVHSLSERETEGVLAHEVMHCFPAGTFVGGDCKAIEDYSVGDTVIDQKGNLVKVVETGQRAYKGKLFTIKAKGMLPVEATDEHPFLVRRAKWVNVEQPVRRQVREWTEAEWVPAKDVRAGDWVAVPQLKGTAQPRLKFDFGNPWSVSQPIYDGITLDAEMAELIGWYVAEGWTSTPPSGVVRTGMAFALHEHHIAMRLAEIVERRIGVTPKIKIHNQKATSYVLTFSSSGFGRWLNQHCGKGALNKQIPVCVLENSDESVLLSFLKSYIKGDGHFTDTSMHFGTVSRTLAMQLQLAFARFGFLCNLHKRKEYTYTIDGKSGQSQPLYHGHLADARLLRLLGHESTSVRSTSQTEVVDGMIFVPVKTVSGRDWEGEVFNFETETHTYSAGNIVTHNCCFQHFTRRMSRDHQIFNMAGDFVINADLLEAGFTLPGQAMTMKSPPGTKGHLYDPQYKGMTTEAVYDLLMKNATIIKVYVQGSGDGKGKGSNDPGQCGGVLDAPGGVNGQEAIKQEWETSVRTAIAVAKSNNAGSIPGSLKRLADDLAKPKISWRDLTRRFIDQSMIKDVSWQRISRRSASIGTLLPGQVSDRLQQLVVFVDTSGSVSEDMLHSMVSEAAGALDEGTADELVIVYADTKVQHVDRYMIGDIVKAEMHGGGGTDFRDSFRWLKENCPEASCVIYLTDMQVSEFGEDPGCPVMWAYFGPEHAFKQLADQAPFGDAVFVTEI